jgi:hypothetical protein
MIELMRGLFGPTGWQLRPENQFFLAPQKLVSAANGSG